MHAFETLQTNGVTQVSASLMGSHLFGLSSPTSDKDYFVVFKEPYTNYLGLNEQKAIPSKQMMVNGELSDVTFMNVKQFFLLAKKSNFTILSSLYQQLGFGYNYGFTIDDFSIKQLGHALVGLINNPKQRNYMQFYSALVVEYLLQFNTVPTTLDWQFLLNKVVLDTDLYDLFTTVFIEKTRGIKAPEFTLPKDYKHELFEGYGTQTLPDFNVLWLNFIQKDIYGN